MISREMLKTLYYIRKQEEKEGVALAPKINVYQHRSNLYGALRKLVELEAINQHEAPATTQFKKTYTITEFGETLLEKSKKAGLIQDG